MSYEAYIRMVSDRLGIRFAPGSTYKITDLKPIQGDIYFDDIQHYDYYGFGDLDVIYGNIRAFYHDDILIHDLISSHEGIISGHLCLFRNVASMRKAYLKVGNWIALLEDPSSTRFDEHAFSHLFFGNSEFNKLEHNIDHVAGRQIGGDVFAPRIYAKEQYSTVFHPMLWHDLSESHPDVWFWKDGVISNAHNLDRQYLYLHLMNFQSMRWTTAECRRSHLPWKDNPDCRFTATGEEVHGVQIDWNGIRALESP
jgi:hypothetical protein